MRALANVVDRSDALKALLKGFSVEVTSVDKTSIEAACQLFPPKTEVFIASLPRDPPERLIEVATMLQRAGLTPVPHVVARNIQSEAALDQLVRGLVEHAAVDRVLLLGGDRDQPAGCYDHSQQLLDSGCFKRHNLHRIFLSCYPEGHPRIPLDTLISARINKLAAAQRAGMDVTLVSQFCFTSAPVIDYARTIRSRGVTVPYRVGVAGPASRARLMKFAVMCGVGPSLRALRGRGELAANMLSGATPQEMLEEISVAQTHEPSLGIGGVHFFTFGSLAKTWEWLGTVTGQTQ
jgi:methylenetetrahydrofolate reductase (NADPH)